MPNSPRYSTEWCVIHVTAGSDEPMAKRMSFDVPLPHDNVMAIAQDSIDRIGLGIVYAAYPTSSVKDALAMWHREDPTPVSKTWSIKTEEGDNHLFKSKHPLGRLEVLAIAGSISPSQISPHP